MDNIDPEKLKELLNSGMEEEQRSQEKSEGDDKKRERKPIESTDHKVNDEKAAASRVRPVIRRRVVQREPLKKEETHKEEHEDVGKEDDKNDSEPKTTDETKKSPEENKEQGKPEIRGRPRLQEEHETPKKIKPEVRRRLENHEESPNPETITRSGVRDENQKGESPKPVIRTRPLPHDDTKDISGQPKPMIRARPLPHDDNKDMNEQPKPEIRARSMSHGSAKDKEEHPKPETRARSGSHDGVNEHPKPEIRSRSTSRNEETEIRANAGAPADRDDKPTADNITIDELAKLLGRSNIINHPLGSKEDPESDPEKIQKLKAILEEQLNNQIQRKLITERQYLHERIENLQKTNTDSSDQIKKYQILLKEKDDAIGKINKEIKDLAAKNEKERNESKKQSEDKYRELEEQRQKEIDDIHELIEKLVTSKEDIEKAREHHEIHQQIIVLVNAIGERRRKLEEEKSRWEAAANKTADILETWQFAYKDICPNDNYLKHILGAKAMEELEYVEEHTKSLKDLFSNEEYQNLLDIKKRQRLLDLQLKSMMGYDLEDIVQTVNRAGKDEDSYMVNDKKISREIGELAMKCHNVREETNKYLKELEKAHHEKV